MGASRWVVLAVSALLALSGFSCTPVHSNKIVGQPLSSPKEIYYLEGLWADQSRFFLVNVEDEEGGVLRVAMLGSDARKLETFTLVVRSFHSRYVLNEEDSVLRGQYAFVLADLYGTDELVVWFSGCSDLADLIAKGELQGEVLDKPLKGASGYGGETEVTVLLKDLTDEQVGRMTDPHNPACESLTWPVTRLRRFR